MKQTAQFGLNQWERTDRVLMEDFNNDNQKIDAALAGLESRSGLKLIKSWTLETSMRGVDITLTDTDWTAWKTIIIDVIPASGTSANINFCYISLSNVIGRISTKWTRLILCPYGQPAAPQMAIYWGASSTLFRADHLAFLGFGNLCLVGDSSSDQLAAGSRIIIRGEPA